MPYGKFKSISEVARVFDIEIGGNVEFVRRLKIDVPDYDFKKIERKLADDLNFINETTICERIISPILEIVASNYELLKI